MWYLKIPSGQVIARLSGIKKPIRVLAKTIRQILDEIKTKTPGAQLR
jgi:hypothetical protein